MEILYDFFPEQPFFVGPGTYLKRRDLIRSIKTIISMRLDRKFDATSITKRRAKQEWPAALQFNVSYRIVVGLDKFDPNFLETRAIGIVFYRVDRRTTTIFIMGIQVNTNQ